MNKLDLGLGGHPDAREDLLFLQKQLSDTIKGFAETTGIPFLVISGVVITVAGTISWTAGYVYINGEVCEVQAGSAAYPANNTFVIVETYDAAGNLVYEDTTVHDTQVYRRAVIQGNAGGTNLYSNAVYLKDYYANIEANSSLSAVIAGGSSWSGGVEIPTYIKNRGRNVELNGSVTTATFATPADDVIATLPAGYRPGNDMDFLCLMIDNTVQKSIRVTVKSNGDIKPIGLVAGHSYQIWFSGIVFPVGWAGF